MSADQVNLNVPVLEEAILGWVPEVEQERRYGRAWKRGNWTMALDGLRKAVTEKKVYNVELDFIKSALSNGIELGLEHLLTAYHAKWHGHFRDMPSEHLDMIYEDVSDFCQFNQAAGRLRRLEKKPEIVAAFPEIGGYMAALAEIAAIWQAISSLKPFVIKGRKPLENPKPIDLTNTGTCSICSNLQKLAANKNMVHHGFQISDGYGHYLGFRSGRCFGVDYRPYELSNAGNIAYKKHLETILDRTKKTLADHHEGRVRELPVKRLIREEGRLIEKTFVVKLGENEFPHLLSTEIRKLEWAIDSLNRDIAFQEHMIKNWTLKPLPGDIPVTV
jgi:hypothetical protein